MFLKIIVGLVLFIAVSALGSGYFGDGFFAFQKEAKAARIVEFTRDVGVVMNTYKAGDNAVNSIVFNIENGLDGLVNQDETDGIAVQFDQVFSVLKNDSKLLKGSGQPEIGLQSVAMGTSAAGVENVFLVNASTVLNDDICQKINDVLGVAAATDHIVLGDVTTVLAANVLSSTAITPTEADALLAVSPGISEGGLEGVCIQDTGIDGRNAFVYYVQGY
jgi:hypothetical protein